MEDFDKLWNYNDPAATEASFLTILEKTGKTASLYYLLQLQTQLARTYSLRRMFKQAYSLLEEVRQNLSAEPSTASIRYHLEFGRTLLAEGKKQEAGNEFTIAENMAKQIGEDFHRIDALHMRAIISNGAIAIKLNEEAVVAALQSKDEIAKNWLGALYNNLGWAYFDLAEYEKSLSIFLRALQWREEKKSKPEIFLAKWCVARVLRAMYRFDDAIKVQLALFEESTESGQADGYVHEELGELYLLKNDKLKSTFHFEKAHELLSQDVYMQNNEPQRLQRIKELSKM